MSVRISKDACVRRGSPLRPCLRAGRILRRPTRPKHPSRNPIARTVARAGAFQSAPSAGPIARRAPHRNPIAATVIGMARDLEMGVIAERVETPETLAFLSERRCEYARGYLFSRPLPAERIDIRKIYRDLA